MGNIYISQLDIGDKRGFIIGISSIDDAKYNWMGNNTHRLYYQTYKELYYKGFKLELIKE